MVEGRSGQPKVNDRPRQGLKPEKGDLRFECKKDARVTVTRLGHKFFGKEGTVKSLGRSPSVRMVKLDDIEGTHAFILGELKEKI